MNYTPQATLIRLLAINALNAYITSWVLYLAGASSDPRMLLPAWISITSVGSTRSTLSFSSRADAVQTLTVLYHILQRKINIKRETSASLSVFSIASFISMCSLLLQLHLTRENDPVVPLFIIGRGVLDVMVSLGLEVLSAFRSH